VPRPNSTQRGFSLIELIVVVVIISVLAALAIPSITSRMRDRRTQQAAQEIVNLYRTARMRAMGRGSAVLVRFDTTAPAGRFQVLEAVRGATPDPSGAATTDPACQRLPVSSCLLTNWTAGASNNQLIGSFDPAARGDFAGVSVQMAGPGAAGAVSELDVCFTPLGRTFVRSGIRSPFAALQGVPVASVTRGVGLTRQVMILPNGHARLGVAELAGGGT
jgi:prepilin-type N-terminal cleavage/methylation domain-containing protein